MVLTRIQIEELRRAASTESAAVQPTTKSSKTLQTQQVPAEVLDESARTVRMSGATSMAAPKSAGQTSKLIAGFDQEIQELGLKVQAFTSERDQLQRMAAEHAIGPPPVSEGFQRPQSKLPPSR